MRIDTAFSFIEGLDQQQCLPTLLESFQSLIRQFGFHAYYVGDPSQPHVLRKDRAWALTWPEGWQRRYAEQRYELVDPVLRRLNASAGPFRWQDVRETADAAGLKVLEDAAGFGLNDGFAVPIHGVEGSLTGVSIGGERFDLTRREEATLHMAVIYFHARLVRLRRHAAPPLAVAKLTPRERECLSWVASGKTDWEIAQILNISEQTAHEYVQNAISKLNAATRAQAVAVAMLSRQILQ